MQCIFSVSCSKLLNNTLSNYMLTQHWTALIHIIITCCRKRCYPFLFLLQTAVFNKKMYHWDTVKHNRSNSNNILLFISVGARVGVICSIEFVLALKLSKSDHIPQILSYYCYYCFFFTWQSLAQIAFIFLNTEYIIQTVLHQLGKASDLNMFTNTFTDMWHGLVGATIYNSHSLNFTYFWQTLQ